MENRRWWSERVVWNWDYGKLQRLGMSSPWESTVKGGWKRTSKGGELQSWEYYPRVCGYRQESRWELERMQDTKLSRKEQRAQRSWQRKGALEGRDWCSLMAREQNWARNDHGRRAGLEANTRTQRPRVRRGKNRGENSHQQGSCRGNWPQREPGFHQSKKKERPSLSPHPEKILRA